MLYIQRVFKKWRDLLFIACASGTISLCLHIYGLQVLKDDYRSQINNELDNALGVIRDIQLEVIGTLDYLNKQALHSCDQNAIKAMRRQVFEARYIKELGYLENDYLQCTTNNVRISPPVKAAVPNYTGTLGVGVALRHPLFLFDQQRLGIVIQKGNFNAVINNTFLEEFGFNDVAWELYFKADNDKVFVAGQQGLETLIESGSSITQNNFNLVRCSDVIPYCFALSANQSAFKAQYFIYLASLTTASVILFLFLSLLLLTWRKSYKSMSARILRGVKANCFFCLYQPIVELESGKPIGFEVLARFRDSDGNVYPDTFIPIISKRNKTWEFTRLVVQQCLNDLARLENATTEKLKVNINAFARDISAGHIRELIELCAPYQHNFKFVLEVTEEESLTSANSIDYIRELVAKDFEFAIDDFGTGYSNLRQLRKIECHTLKIDRSYISEMEDGSVRSTLIPHIVGIAQNIDANVVAEGVENNQQRKALMEYHIKYAQGYMFGKPMPMDKFINLLS